MQHLRQLALYRRRRLWILGIGVAFALVVTAAALAAFRGERGRIAFDDGRTFPSLIGSMTQTAATSKSCRETESTGRAGRPMGRKSSSSAHAHQTAPITATRRSS